MLNKRKIVRLSLKKFVFLKDDIVLFILLFISCLRSPKNTLHKAEISIIGNSGSQYR